MVLMTEKRTYHCGMWSLDYEQSEGNDQITGENEYAAAEEVTCNHFAVGDLAAHRH